MRQLVVACPEAGILWADVLLDVRALTRGELESRRGWTFTLAEARALAADAAMFAPAGATVYLVELVGRPDRASSSGASRRYAAESFCRVLHTITIPSTDAAAAA